MVKKKQTKQKTKLLKKFNWKVLALVLTGLVLLLGVVAQIVFNQIVWQQLNQNSSFPLRTLIKESLDNLTDQKSVISADNRITELHLQLPSQSTFSSDPDKILYAYVKAEEGYPEYAQITSVTITRIGMSGLNNFTHDELFRGVPIAQACSRGFTLNFEDKINHIYEKQENVGSKKLADGRTMYLWRERECIAEAQMDNLQKYLLQVQSY